MRRRWMVVCFCLLVACAVVGLGLQGVSTAQQSGSDTKQACPMAGKACGTVVYHVVCFKYKDSATDEQIEGVSEAFANLKNEIPFITSYRAGTNVSPEGLDKGFTHCYILTFKNQEDRDKYLPHPAHKAFGKKLGPILDDVFVIDFEAAAPWCMCADGGCGGNCPSGGTASGGSGSKSK